MKIKVLVKDPGKKPRSVYISNTLKNLQKTVDGHIECVTFAEDMVIICNEEGRIKGLPYNCNICGIDFVGTIIFAGMSSPIFLLIMMVLKRYLKACGTVREMNKCKRCGTPVKFPIMLHSTCWETEVSKVAEIFCDKYCRFPIECQTQDELDEHCDSCDLIKLCNIGMNRSIEKGGME